ncbi:MAG: cupin domain-containing protein [Burkholderiales bacterium]|nr:cupin domain-containing protein [Burkholderiales bacterium]
MTKKLLSGLGRAAFLRQHWQKKPLLARQALPDYAGLLDRDALFELAARDDMQSRLVIRNRGRWRVEHGPFARRDLARLPKNNWTLLVQGVNHVLPEAQELLLEFAFIPYARLDDIMVSYAPPGGGVGPHFDSYDVFLLQLAGTRRWRISAQRDLMLVENAPLRILRGFRPQHEWLLAPGDMLYLPPRHAHDGIAVDDCLTCSIGFRAPSAQELGTRFLEFLQDRLALKGMYRDPGLKLQRHPAQISSAMLRQMRHMIGRIRWHERDVVQFAGQFLTEPGPLIVFDRPHRPLTPQAFALQAERHGVRLALKTRMLCRGHQLFINGERCETGSAAARVLLRLADRRRLPPRLAVGKEAAHWLYQWYRAGYIEIDRSPS